VIHLYIMTVKKGKLYDNYSIDRLIHTEPIYQAFYFTELF